jgi:hypothetical protein
MNDANLLKTPFPAAYLVPVFVTESEEAYLLGKIEEVGGTPVEEATDGTGDDALNGTNTSSSTSPRKFKSKPTGWKEVKGRRCAANVTAGAKGHADLNR